MLPIAPHSDDIQSIYKSGYFKALDNECRIVADAFLAVKTMSSNPSFAWVFLNDLERKNNLSVTVYDRKGRRVAAPGFYFDDIDPVTSAAVNSLERQVFSFVKSGSYYTFIPIFKKAECSPCHQRVNDNGFIGLLAFKQDYDAHVYYSGERVLLFLGISIVLCFLLFMLVRWHPDKPLKEMFDKDH